MFQNLGRTFQLGYVVDDLDRAMADWRRRYPIGPFYLMENVKVEDALYRGAPFELEMTAALAQAGDIQVELLYQHSPAPSALTDTANGASCVLNHLGIITPDLEGGIAFLEEQGHPVAMRGCVFGRMGFAYIDTTQVFGHMVELVPEDPEILEAFAMVARSAVVPTKVSRSRCRRNGPSTSRSAWRSVAAAAIRSHAFPSST